MTFFVHKNIVFSAGLLCRTMKWRARKKIVCFFFRSFDSLFNLKTWSILLQYACCFCWHFSFKSSLNSPIVRCNTILCHRNPFKCYLIYCNEMKWIWVKKPLVHIICKKREFFLDFSIVLQIAMGVVQSF